MPDKQATKDINTRIGENLRLIRQIHNLTQTQLGEMLNVTFQQVQKYERGSNNIKASHLKVLNHRLGVPYADFFEDFGWEKSEEESIKKQTAYSRMAMKLFLSIKSEETQKKVLELLKALEE